MRVKVDGCEEMMVDSSELSSLKAIVASLVVAVSNSWLLLLLLLLLLHKPVTLLLLRIAVAIAQQLFIMLHNQVNGNWKR